MPVVVVVAVSFLTCLLESKSVLQESTLAVCKASFFILAGAVLRQLQLKGQVEAAVLSALTQDKFCCQNPISFLPT